MIGCYGYVSVCLFLKLWHLNQWLIVAGASLFFAVRGIAADLRHVRDLTQIKHVEKEDKMISEGTEDGSESIIYLVIFFS